MMTKGTPKTSTAAKRKNPITTGSTAGSATDAEALVQRTLQQAGLLAADNDDGAVSSTTTITTKAGWCLRQGLLHVATLDAGLAQRIAQHGVPDFYACHKRIVDSSVTTTTTQLQDVKDPTTCFESLCRIIVGQFISGKAARAAWRKVLSLRGRHAAADALLTPLMVLEHTGPDGQDLAEFQTSLGLTKNKARSLHDLACRFHDGRLSEEFLRSTDANAKVSAEAQTEAIRQALLQVRGIGEWSCDMFLLFTLEHSDILPLGDLGVRKGIAKHFFVGKSTVCAKKDKAKIHERLAPFRPYRSLVSYYMWRVADTPEAVIQGEITLLPPSPSLEEPARVDVTKGTPTKPNSPNLLGPEPKTPPNKRAKRSSARTVTP